MAWDLDTARGWVRLICEVAIIVGALGLIYIDTAVAPPADPITVGAGLSLIAGVFGWRQDTKRKDDAK